MDSTPPVNDTSGPPPGGLILVVDDEPMIRDLAKLALGRAGYEIETAASAPEALQCFETCGSRLAAVILDKNLHGADGFELLAILRAQVPGLPALLISGDILADSGDDVRTPEGPTALVGKPFRLEELGRALERVIAARDA